MACRDRKLWFNNERKIFRFFFINLDGDSSVIFGNDWRIRIMECWIFSDIDLKI